jgi:hypothetical protein
MIAAKNDSFPVNGTARPTSRRAFQSLRSALDPAGQAAVGKVRVACDPAQPILLAADPERRLVVLLNYGEVATQATLRLPDAAPPA